jgi:preprotein translocase subunit SecF
MEIIKPGILIDFMRLRKPMMLLSFALVALSLASLVFPGPKFGIDFAGGTEIQLVFGADLSAGEVRQQLVDLGYEQPDVVSVEGSSREYILRIKEVSALSDKEAQGMQSALSKVVGEEGVERFKVSPGGDKLAFTLSMDLPADQVETILKDAGGNVRSVEKFGTFDDHRFEAHLVGIGDELLSQLESALGDKGPEKLLRVEWVGPKAGQQLRDSAIKSLLYAVGFILVYIAFRFDLRFAPGAIAALFHDVLITLGVYVLLRREMNLTTVAALLTVLGYSINDTIVVYDRIRENAGRFKDKTMRELINMSMSQVISRTIVTSMTTLLSIIPFMIWGTPAIRDIVFALGVGILIGTYSSIYVSSPMTEWIDRRWFQKGVSAASPKKATA